MLTYLRLLLLPLSVLYGLIVLIRNKFYDWGVFKAVQFDIPVIGVGNLVVGGSGKSPVTEYLIDLLPQYKIAILSRGYGRKTKGYLLADEHATAQTIGDEPMQFYRKFKQVTVAVCEDRVKGINELKDHHDLIILDDGYQHRRVKPGFNILLFEFQKLLSPQFLLPAGNLREPFKGYHRAQFLLITKSPVNISPYQRAKCAEKFNLSAAEKTAFSFIGYHDLVHLSTKETKPCSTITSATTIFLLTGIANPKPLLSHLAQFSAKIIHHNYPDHHQFSTRNVIKLIAAFNNYPSKEKLIVTTEKDAQRLLNVTIRELLLNLPVFYLPIKIVLRAEDKATFDQKILDYVSSTTRNR